MYEWIDRRKAQARLGEIEAEVGQLEREAAFIADILSSNASKLAGPVVLAKGKGPTKKAPAARAGQKIGLLSAVVEALRGEAGLTASEIQAKMAKAHPEFVGRKPELISAALFQSVKSKSPKVKRVGKPGTRVAPTKWAAA